MSRRLNEDEVDRIRGRAGLHLFTLYLGVLFAIGATVWLTTLVVDSARKGDAMIVVAVVLVRDRRRGARVLDHDLTRADTIVPQH